MIKKLRPVLILLVLVLSSFANESFTSASVGLGSVSDVKNHQQKFVEVEVYLSPQADRVSIQLDKRDFGGELEQPLMYGGESNSFMRFRFYCAANVIISWHRIGTADYEKSETVRITPQFINSCMCDTAKNTAYPTFKDGIQWLPQTSKQWFYPSGFGACGYDGSQDQVDDNGGSGEGDGNGGGGSDGNGGDNGGGTGGDGTGGNNGGGSGGNGGATNGNVTMGWNHASNPSKGSPNSYKVIRDGVVIETIPGTNNSYTDTTAKVGETHDYRVVPVYPDGTEGDEINLGSVEVKEGEETVIPGGPVSGKCDPCKIFDCPDWDRYMGKLDDIKDKIPPPPNWSEVADEFRDSIVPSLVGDLDTMLGRAPEPPPVPPQLPGLDDRGIKNHEPEMKDVPGLKESGFDANKIKNEAPKIPERDDPTGGFDLIKNPMDTLPDAPTNPKPGSTDAGEWGQNKPKEESNPFPFPKDTGTPEVGKPPKPNDNGAKPPTPGGDAGSAPKPGGDSGNAPTPGGTGGDAGMKDYKPNPSAPDGSGGDMWP